MKKLYFLLVFLGVLFYCNNSFAQVLSVTATITDSDTTVWDNCSISAILNSPNGSPFYNGTSVSTSIIHGTCSSGGVIAISLNNTNTITPTGAQYQVTICSNTSAPCSTFLTSITTANQTTNFSALVTAPRFSAAPGAYGYNNIEVSAKTIGQGYYNVTTPGYEICNGNTCASVSGGGAPTTCVAGTYACTGLSNTFAANQTFNTTSADTITHFVGWHDVSINIYRSNFTPYIIQDNTYNQGLWGFAFGNPPSTVNQFYIGSSTGYCLSSSPNDLVDNPADTCMSRPTPSTFNFGDTSGLANGTINAENISVNGGVSTVYICSGGTFSGLLSTSSGACTGGSGTITHLSIN